MYRICSVLCVLAFLGAIGLFAFSVHEAGAACANPPTVPEDAQWRGWPTSDVADGSDEFDTSASPGTSADLHFSWIFESEPLVGQISFETDDCENVSGLSCTPTDFYPSDKCYGGRIVNVIGTLDSSPGTVEMYGWVWRSNNPVSFEEDWHTLTVTDS